MNKPCKTDDNNRTHKNDATTLYFDICGQSVNASFWTSASYGLLFWNLEDPVQVQTLSYNSKQEKNNLPPITDWLFPYTDFYASGAGCWS